jgi:hypothetical protein
VTTNLAKVAHGIGITPLAYLTWSLAGAALLLTIVSGLRGQVAKLNRRSVEYFIIAGFLSTAGANLIFFIAAAGARVLHEPADVRYAVVHRHRPGLERDPGPDRLATVSVPPFHESFDRTTPTRPSGATFHPSCAAKMT